MLTKCDGAPAEAATLLPSASADPRSVAVPVASDRFSSESVRSSTFGRSSLSTDGINTASADFFTCLTEPPLPTEHMLRKVASLEAVVQQREALRALVREADVEQPAMFASGIQLRLLAGPT